jgi:hypothetical protein
MNEARKSFAGTLLNLFLIVACTQAARAQLPAARLKSIFPAGGQQGQSFQATLSGSDLDEVARLHFSHPGITAVHEENNRFLVTVADDVPIGLYDVRAIGRFGISSPRAFMIGQWPESVEQEPNQTESADIAALFAQANEVTLNSTVNGASERGTDIDYYKFFAQRGQRVLIDCWAHRIDSRLDGTLAVFDIKGRRLAGSRDVNRRDPLVDLGIPADGVYLIKLWDFVYGDGGGDGASRPTPEDYFYRLAIGTAPHLDYIFPAAGVPGTTGSFTLYGRNLPGGTPADGQ